MSLQNNLSKLDRIYQAYQDFISGPELACKPGCSACCTRNVTMTTLEGHYLLSQLKMEEKQELLARIKIMEQGKRFQPRITINDLAERCMRGEDIPDEDKDDRAGPCSILEDDLCYIYRARPFHCRCMVSADDCGVSGCASMDDFILTVNNMFLQLIEHVDFNGYTGNLVDILLYLEEKLEEKNENSMESGGPGQLIPNRPARILMIPPEHRKKIDPLLGRLQKILLPSEA